MKTIRLVPIEKSPSIVLEFLKHELPKRIPGITVEIEDYVIHLPHSTYNSIRRQYDSDAVLEFLKGIRILHRGFRILGLADVDAYSDYLNFVFGQAELYGRYAVVYLVRLRPEFYGSKADERLFLDRVLKESLHELGHTFGLLHCTSTSCVMRFSNSIIDTDLKLPKFCTNCLQKIMKYLSSEI